MTKYNNKIEQYLKNFFLNNLYKMEHYPMMCWPR